MIKLNQIAWYACIADCDHFLFLTVCFPQDDEDFDDEDTAGPPTSRRRESRALAEDDEYDVETEQNVQSTKRARQSVLNDSDEDS